jgi:hypothetical protein
LEDLEALKTLAQEEQRSKKFVRSINEIPKPNAAERTIDRAIENSKNGQPTILDGVPAPGEDTKSVREYLEKKGHSCPAHFVIVHVPIAELANRQIKRNIKAFSKDGNYEDRIMDLSPMEQYSSIFGAGADAQDSLAVITKQDVFKAAESVLKSLEAIKPSDQKESKQDPEAESKAQGEKLIEKLGFNGQEAIFVKPKIKVDKIYDHSQKESTVGIAEEIHSWTAQNMKEQQKESKSFVEELGVEKRTNESFVERMRAGRYGNIGSKGGANEL